MKLNVLYFAHLREKFDVAEETVEFAGTNVFDLITHLQTRGGAWAEELGPGKTFRIAVNQVIAQAETAIPEGAEVAIFPPVTGG